MIRSMTGFGSASGRVGPALLSVEIRTVNHRFFTPTIKLPSSLGRWEGEVREAMRKGIGRGHATIAVRFDRDERPGLTIDEERFARYVEQLRALETKHALQPVDVGTILRLPDVISGEARDPIDDSSVGE